jgi:hypothetical protein
MDSSRPINVRLGSMLGAFGLLLLVTGVSLPATLAAPTAMEEVIGVRRVHRQAVLLTVVFSRVTIPVGAVWETDPDAGPLSLTVQMGELGILLDGGSARIERRPNPLTGGQIGPLRPGQLVRLGPGDRLVVVRGFHLTLANDGSETAIAIVSRLRV